MTIKNLVDFISNMFLFFTRESIVILITTIGFLGFKKDIFGKALFILLFSLILNAKLKSFFQIPLPTHLGEGFAFPSGHMQNAVVFWGCLAFEFRHRLFSGFFIFLLSGIAFGLIHFGYHTPHDIIYALFFGCIILIAYYYFLKYLLLKRHFPLPLTGILLSIFTIPMIATMPKYIPSNYLSIGALMGFSLGWFLQDKFLKKNSNTFTLKRKIQLIILAILGVVFIKMGFQYTTNLLTEPLSLFVCFFLIGLWVSVGCLLFSPSSTPPSPVKR